MSGIWEVRVGKSMGSTGYEIRVQGRLLQVFFCRAGEETRQLNHREQRVKRRCAGRVPGFLSDMHSLGYDKDKSEKMEVRKG